MNSPLLLLLLLPATVYGADPLPCPKALDSEPFVTMGDFKWGMSLDEMKAVHERIYASGKRLKGHAYWSEADNAYIVERLTGKTKLTAGFIRNTTRHIEIALERRYADFAFFPDMGHSHLYIPEADWAPLESIEPKDTHVLYEKMLALPGLKQLYHTAEQLAVREGARNKGAFPQDKILLWRYFTRNPVGDNVDGENVAPVFAFTNDSYNTVGELAGFHSYSSGIALHATKDGCFTYKHPDGSVQRFDLGLDDPPFPPGGDDMLRPSMYFDGQQRKRNR